MTTNTYGGYTVDQLREFIRHHYDAEHGGHNIDELTNDSSASVNIVRDLLDAIEPQKDGDLLRPIARWVYNAVRVNLDLLHGICAEFGCPQGEDVATWLRARLAGVPTPCMCSGLGPCEQRTDGSCRREPGAVPAQEVAAWMHADDPSDCISDARKRSMLENNGIPGRRNAENYSIALGVITPAQAAEPVAIRDPNYVGGVKLLRDLPPQTKLYAAPQPPAQVSGIIEAIAAQWDGCTYESPGEDIDIGTAIRGAWKRLSGVAAQADAREGLTDEQIIERCKAAGIKWIPPELPDHDDHEIGFPGSFDMADMDEMRALLAAHPGQPEPRAEVADGARCILTYLNQPDNVGAWRLGEACRATKPGGDPIDHGLSLLQELQAKGFGVVAIDTAHAGGDQ